MRMWCSDCSQDFDTVAGSVVQVCPGCREAERSGRRFRRVPKLDADDAVPRRSGSVLVRDQGRPAFSQLVPASAHTLKTTAETATATPARSNARIERKSTVHLVGFGLFVFLVGQALQIWAFIQEQLLIWSLANLVSIAGVTVAFTGALVSLQGFDRRLQDLARLVGRAEITARPRRRTLRDRISGKRD